MPFISLRPWEGFPGVPAYVDMTLTEQIDGKDPYNKPVRTTKWFDYDVYQGNPVPPSGEFALPDELYCLCSGIKTFDTDFYYSGYFYRFIVSEKFLLFIENNSFLEGAYDYCPLTILSKKLEPITQQPYYLLRVFRFHQELINWQDSPTVAKKESFNKQVYYPELVLAKTEQELPGLFFANQRGFSDCFFCTEPTKQLIDKQLFRGIALVSPTDYVGEQQYRDDHLSATPKEARQRDKIRFAQ
ncbi:Imm43 family immunity protein [Fibrella aquatilis]|uniref:Immunity protein 43 domain-containing protein n=1 Tax=Fibrella aquatilis TaxID=2817059 RepID=A0A939G6H1_9BACT|nr:Imm43 family immunity protein [Fibrella aquatilis]MBO0933297.1 hypothetical protein [Fibrella aquatilis]